MSGIQTDALPLMRFTQQGDPDNAVAAAWPVYWATGAASTAAVYVELEPGMRLPRHTDSAEELLVILDGEIEATVGERRLRAGAGGLVLIPAMAPHGAINSGETTARFIGVFPSNTVVSVFEHDFEQTGGRVVGTPPPGDGQVTEVSA